jgi:hypothetical protein
VRNRYPPLSVLAALFVSIRLFQLLQALVLERTRPSKSDGSAKRPLDREKTSWRFLKDTATSRHSRYPAASLPSEIPFNPLKKHGITLIMLVPGGSLV